MLRDRFIQITATLALVAVQLGVWPLLLKANQLPAEVPFWYTLPPSQRLAPLSYLWSIPLIVTCLALGNLLAAKLIYQRFAHVARLLVATSALVCFMGSYGVIKTILIYTTLP
jgi:hypothetical protein